MSDQTLNAPPARTVTAPPLPELTRFLSNGRKNGLTAATTETINAARHVASLFFDPQRVQLVDEVIQRRGRDF
ncbi:hypothetical protein [Microvirga puerhi]|uniref:Uncharacterized protein n=1 Tax=Microvirga puerhi TaxID=2876078 RepID=A0ABS7VVJ3_9HYPH|nr:hypothetical protein [Microvirga puerhi]MBZ6078927.1 hypothetical protein [Microvirga puerhi]